uniref:Tetraspanin-10 n=1 Tax=Neogobius melanostomus TaxID=47308 RepID=A0A8C6T4V4_9GOBI
PFILTGILHCKGTSIYLYKESFAQEKIGSIGTDPMLLLVSLGFLLFMLCLTGCVGALRENSCLLKVFSAVVLALIAAQVVMAILVYSLQDQIGNYLRSGMLTAMGRYQDDLDLRFIMDEVQSNLQCCGADTYRDWEVNIYYNCSAPGVLACGVPATCCVDPLENGTVWNSQCGVGALIMDEHISLDRTARRHHRDCGRCNFGSPDGGSFHHVTADREHTLAQVPREEELLRAGAVTCIWKCLSVI